MLHGPILCLCAQAVDFISKQQPLSQPHQEVTREDVLNYVTSACPGRELADDRTNNEGRLANALNDFTTSEEVMKSVKSFRKELQRARDEASGASMLTRFFGFFRLPEAFSTLQNCDKRILNCSLEGTVDFVVGIKKSLKENGGEKLDFKGDARALEVLDHVLSEYATGKAGMMDYLSTQSKVYQEQMKMQRQPLDSFASAVTVIADLERSYCQKK